MTLLEYICESLMGPPTSTHGNGESHWPCPLCSHPRFHTLPHKPQFKDRVKCWSCGFRGDLHDLLREFYPDENYRGRLVRIDQFRRDWRLKRKHQPLITPGTSGRSPAEGDEFDPAVTRAIRKLGITSKLGQPGDPEPIRLAERALRLCVEANLDPLLLAERLDAEAEFREQEAEHLATCQDPSCTAACCRRARGWSEKAIKRAIERGRQRRQSARNGRRHQTNSRVK